ncbi:hypothetical protein PENSPDRAFT_695386 [Peniophora sp. CONT]|nr:hypothetical protein PENSPDRAFT_695386 [Peniophora sp. CONT]
MAANQIPEELNAVLVFTTGDLGYACDPLKSRDNLRQHLDGGYLATDDDRRFLQHELADVLNSPQYKKVCSFFHRDPSVLDWYYSMYARESCDEPANAVAAIVCGKETPKGAVVIIKDGPADKWDMLKTEMDVDEVAKTLWYYHKSGVSAQAEFGERTLLRILMSEISGPVEAVNMSWM